MAASTAVNLLQRTPQFCNLVRVNFTHIRHFSTTKISKNIQRILVTEENIGKELETKAWVRGIRQHKGVTFLDINDGSCARDLQVVVKPHAVQRAKELSFGCSVQVRGELVQSRSKGQTVELLASSLNVIGSCDTEAYPFKVKSRHPLEYGRHYPHLRPRTPTFAALLRLRSAATAAVHSFFQSQDYINVHTPVLTSSDCEGAGELFSVKPSSLGGSQSEDGDHFFGVPAYLTVSGQLQLETIACSHSKAYTFGPAFRAENSRTRRHLAEFYMVEAEIGFTESLQDLIEVMEPLVKFVGDTVYTQCAEDVQYYNEQESIGHIDEVQRILQRPFVVLSYTEAISILEKHRDKFEFPPSWGIDLQSEHERYLVCHCDNVPVFIVDYPADIKPFYTRVNEESETAAAVDLLVPGVGELIGGSLREDRLDKLQHRLQAMGLEEQYQWYLDLRRFGSVQHGGFGLGFERLLQFLLGIDHIQDVIPFPRYSSSCQL